MSFLSSDSNKTPPSSKPPRFFSKRTEAANILEEKEDANMDHQPREALPSLSMFKLSKPTPEVHEPRVGAPSLSIFNAKSSPNPNPQLPPVKSPAKKLPPQPMPQPKVEQHQPREALPSLSMFKLFNKPKPEKPAEPELPPAIAKLAIPKLASSKKIAPPVPPKIESQEYIDESNAFAIAPTQTAAADFGFEEDAEFKKEFLESMKEDEYNAIFRKQQMQDLNVKNKNKKSRYVMLAIILFFVGVIAAVLFMSTDGFGTDASSIELTCSLEDQEAAKLAIKESFSVSLTSLDSGAVVYNAPDMTCLPTDAFRDLTEDEIVSLQAAEIFDLSNIGLEVMSALWAGEHEFLNLKEFDFSFNSLQVVQDGFLQNAPNVEILNFDSNQIKTLTAGSLLNGDNLIEISMKNMLSLESLPEGIKSLPKLEKLDFADCGNLDSKKAGFFADCDSLKLVDFTRTKVVRAFREEIFRTFAQVASTTQLIGFPTDSPTNSPTGTPTVTPTQLPTTSPTTSPTSRPTTLSPSASPTTSPTKNPTKSPTPAPTKNPTKKPTPAPTRKPTPNPTPNPTPRPTTKPPTSPPTYY